MIQISTKRKLGCSFAAATAATAVAAADAVAAGAAGAAVAIVVDFVLEYSFSIDTIVGELDRPPD